MVDTHVHLMDPGDTSRETFELGTAAAACNGVTTIIEHTHGWPVTTAARLAEKRDHLNGRSHIDFGLAAHVWPDQMTELPRLWHDGISFFKIFTCTTHGVPAIRADLLFDVFGSIAALDGACLVHCEDDLITAHNERLLRAAGRLDAGLLTEWRSREAELVAIGTVALAARLTGARATIAHVSSAEALRLLEREQQLGSPAVAETCPQYLFLPEHELHTYGPLRKFTPPARIRTSADEDAMWDAFNSARVHHLSTDHAPSTLEQKRTGSIWDAPFGLPGLDTTFRLMLDAALSGRTSLERLVQSYSEAPARQYRLDGKGQLVPGADADMVIVDPHSRSTISNSRVISKAGWTPYADRDIRGRIVRTLLRGSTIASDGRPSGERIGCFLPGPGARRLTH
jgi:dihydroorotase-like cyclic amidohydrolase